MTIYKLLKLCSIFLISKNDVDAKKIKTGPLIDLQHETPCEDKDVEAATALTERNDRDKLKACDRLNETFYHSEDRLENPYITLNLRESYLVKTITVVNVHTGAYCTNTPIKCIMRLNGSTVEVLKGTKSQKICGHITVEEEDPLTAAGQTYKISCGEGGELVQGNRVRISQNNTAEGEESPYLMIAEVQASGYKYLTTSKFYLKSHFWFHLICTNYLVF